MDEDQRIKRGFAVGENAAEAARKNHALGTAHQFTPEEARRAGELGRETQRRLCEQRCSALTPRAK